jgi:type III pantothenate kinase
MKLLFDIGNTRIKWAYDTGSDLLHRGEITHRDMSPADAVGFVAQLRSDIESVWAINVAGRELESALSDVVQEHLGMPLRVARTAQTCGQVVNGYSAIEQLGADRWAAIVGAWNYYRKDLCVVDAGTAVTIDLVQADGHHQGGFILPGARLMVEALNRDTSDIEGFASRGEASPGEELWCGSDTRSAVQLGALFALRAAVGEAAGRIARSGADAPAVVLTGGDARLLLPVPGCTPDLRPMLVLEGLRHLAAEAN